MHARQKGIQDRLFKKIMLAGAVCLVALSSAPPALAVGDLTACAAFPAVTTGSEVAGTLDAVADCFQAPPNRLIDNYSLTLAEPAVLDLVLESAAFGGAVGIRHPNPSVGVPGQFIGQRGRNTAGAVTAHFVLPAGSYVVYVTSVITNPTAPPAGNYTLNLNTVAQPQAACENGALNGSIVVRNSQASGTITAQDCALGPRDDIVTGEVPRNVDSYSLFAPLNVYNQFTVEADFDYRIERWEAVGANPLAPAGYVDFMPAGSTRHYNIQEPVNATHFLYIAAATPGGGGTYTLTVQNYPAQQHSALMDLYTSTGGATWTNRTGWGGAAGTECTWFGITCLDGLVTQLNLHDNNLSGTIPESLTVLNRVSSLDISENALTGSLPVSLGYMDELRYVNLHSNQLSGLLPGSLEYSDILVSLSLSSNLFSGPIPEYLSEKEDLERLYLSGNRFSGPLPASLADLPALTHLHVQYNRLTGVIPAALVAKGLAEFQHNNNPFDLTDPDERAALLALYNSTNGAAWTNKTNWGGAAGTECTWFGVTCSDGHVQELRLNNNNLVGTLPAQLGDLSRMAVLNLDQNKLSGTLPAALGHATQLRYLYLGNNLLTGTIPAEWGTLASLVELHLYTNQLSGSIPSWLADVDTLKRLYLPANQFSGAIPADLADLPALTHLHLHFNRLTGVVPAALMAKGLTEFQYNNNPFDLTDPDERIALLALYDATNGAAWTNKTNWGGAAGTECTWFGVTCSDGHVRELQLPNNNLVGPLPAQLGDLDSLRTLILRQNKLSGTLPAALGNLSLLSNLDLGNNLLTGNLPPEWAALTSMKFLHLHTNQLSGSIPVWLDDLIALEVLNLSGNQFSGAIPAGLADLPALTHLQLANNRLTGVVPPALVAKTLTLFQIGNNPFDLTDPDERAALLALYDATNGAAWTNKTNWGGAAGTECTWFGVVCSGGHVLELQLANNNLVGPLPAQLGDLGSLSNLTLRQNKLSGALPASLGGLSQLRLLDLGNNLLTGSLPVEWAGMTALKSLYLYTNQLSGALPAWVSQLNTLERLYLSGNQFSAQIPAGLADLPALTHLELQFNRFTGAVPAALLSKGLTQLLYNNNPFDLTDPAERVALLALYDATNGTAWTNKTNWGGAAGTECTWFGVVCSDGHVRELQLPNNNLVGPLPAQLGDLDRLRNLILRQNKLSGTLPASLGNLSLLSNLDLGNNLLTGNLPPEWAALTSLKSLYLYTNQLSGSIPVWLDDLIALEVLNLSGNQFSGMIPASLADLPLLRDLNLQFNQLIGTVPAGLLDVTVLNVSNNPFSTESANDRAALIALYNATGGEQWLNSTNWLNETPGTLCTWYGVSCISGRVSTINMLVTINNIGRGNRLVGTLPEELGLLSQLRNLTLPHNQLSASIPASLGTLSQLRQINLIANQLAGTIPENLGSLPELTQLQLSSNRLTGSIPATLGNLPKLQILNLFTNLLSGSIPASLGNIATLTQLRLNDNQLTGSLPPQLGNLSNLTILDARTNLLDGEIPASFANLDKVTSLSLQGNHLSGAIPAALADMVLLSSLNLGLNDLSGNIPVELGAAPALSRLNLAFNQLAGSIPAELANIDTLRSLQLQENQLSGTVPPALDQLALLETLWLQNNPLTGTLPETITALPLLTSLDVSGTALELPEIGNAVACAVATPLALGAELSGTLVAAGDCFVKAGRLSDQFQLTLTEPAIFTATLASEAFRALAGMNSADGEIQLAFENAPSVIAPATQQPAVLQYALPAGQYRPFASTSVNNPLTPLEGAYTLGLSAAQSQPQDGCTVSSATMVVVGSGGQGSLQSNDCVSSQFGDNGRVNDRYAFMLKAGEQIWISVEGDIDLRHSLRVSAFDGLLPIAIIEDALPAAEQGSVSFTALSDSTHFFSVMPSVVGETGDYTLYFANHAPLPEAQRNALFTLYNSTNGAGWTDSAGWLGHPGTECTWAGITCTDGVVTGIDLSDNLLTGTIPAALGELSGLLSLNLADNNLAGVVPDVFGDAVVINIENNPLDNTLPAQVVSRGEGDVFYLKSGNLVSFYYDVSNADSTLTGLGLSVHVDSSVVATARFTNVLSTSLVSYDTTLTADSSNADGIASTDRLLNIAWADFNGAWPGTLPVKLFDLEVKAQNSATVSTLVRIGFARTANASQFRLTLPSVSLTPVRETFDVDRDGTVQALSDALLIVRNMFEFSGDALIAQAIASGAVNNTLAGISARLVQLDPALDVDRNGNVDALTDGLLILRYLFGFRGDVLVDDAIGAGATRATATQIETYLAGFTQL